jgi:hypothetical protein
MSHDVASIPIRLAVLQLLLICPGSAQHSTVTYGKDEPPVERVLEPEPGDRVYIDPGTGRLICESRGLRRATVLRNQTQPNFETTASSTIAGASYSFFLSNGPAAKQAVHFFSADLPGFVEIQQDRVPAHWLFLRPVEQKSTGLRRVTWTSYSQDDVDRLLLFRPGMQAGPFVYTANAWPGLISVQVFGYKPTPKDGSSDEAIEPLIGRMSEWTLEEARKALDFDVNHFAVYVVGPKLRPDQDLVPQLRKELALAGTLEEFRSYKAELELLTTYSTAGGIEPKLIEMEKNAKGLPRDFFRAILSTIRAARP